ncbi:MAG: IPT/TIG domain-containing protein [Deltaproteobacteria bacterium]|nr:IPT/TIG domain-containing protein [Deltaproteobacteria bacterium]
MMRTLSTFPRLLAALLLALVWLPACSDDGSSSADITDSSTSVDGSADGSGAADTAVDTATDTGPDSPDFGDDSGEIGDVTRPDTSGSGEETDTTPNPGGLLIDAFDPSSGPTTGGTRFILTGAGFSADTLVYIDGQLAERIDLVDAFTIYGVTPAGNAGQVDVKVADTESQDLLADAFTYVAPVAISSVEPDRSPTEGGAPLIVTGTGFTADAQVSIGGRLGMQIRFISDTRLELLAPAGSVGPADLRVTTRNDSVRLADGFSYFEVTRLLDVLPGAGSDAGGELVTLTGRGLEDAAQVLFGGVEATIVSTASDRVTVLTPAGSVGPTDVLVYALSGGGDLLADGYFYTNLDSPAGIVAIRPASGSIDGGDLVTVVTVGAGARDTVRFGGLRASPISSAGGTFVVRTPAGSLGAVDVSVTGGADAPLVAPDGFSYFEPMALLELDPPSGDVAGGTEVVFRGTGFEAGTTVRFGALSAASVTFVSSEELRVVTPPGTVGAVPVALAAPTRSLTLEDGFRYTQPLSVVGYSPSRGSIAGGTYVIVRGTGFEPGLAILFGDQPAASVEVLDPATVAVRTPPAETAAPVVVKAQLGATTVNGPGKFTYYNPTTDAGGWWGGDILGSVNVTVVDNNGPIANAFVTLSVRASETGFSGRTDGRGQVTLSGPDLSGVQTLFASAKKHSSVSVTRVNASNVLVVLQSICGCYTNADCEADETCDLGRMVPVCVSSQSCVIDGDCSARPNFICEGADETVGLAGLCAEDCSGEPPEPPPLGTIFGLLRGLDKITVPGPNQRLRAVVVTTVNGQVPDPGPNNTFVWDGTRAQPYELTSRLGDVVVVGLCGVEDLTTGDFEPRYMAIYRPLFVEGDQRYEVNFECDIHLNRSLQVKVINPPFAPGGAEVNRINATLDFGGEGTLSVWETQSTASISTLARLAPLEGQLAGLNYTITARAEPNGGGVPFSQSMQRTVVAFDALVTMPSYVPPARGITPGPGELLVGRRVEWGLDTEIPADFFYAYITDTSQQTTYWEVYLPGDQLGFDLPEWPADAPRGPFPSGNLLLIIISVDAFAFDYDSFEFNDFNFSNWKSYSLNGWGILNP